MAVDARGVEVDRGPPLDWTEEQMTALAAVDDAAIDAARRLWRREAGGGLGRLLDARPVGERADGADAEPADA